MHEVSLGQSIRDYLTGEVVEETTYEELRQGLARLLVEEKGFPREAIRPRLVLSYQVQDRVVETTLDFGIFREGDPALLVLFCPGEVGSFIRQSVAAARLWRPPFPLVLVTDTKTAALVRVSDMERLAQGFSAVPSWEELVKALAYISPWSLQDRHRPLEERIHYGYTGYGSCCGSQCSPPEGAG